MGLEWRDYIVLTKLCFFCFDGRIRAAIVRLRNKKSRGRSGQKTLRRAVPYSGDVFAAPTSKNDDIS